MAVHITTMKATEKPISNYYEYEKKKKATLLLSAHGSHPASVSSLEKQNGFV